MRREIQGLRAVAVILVVVFHLWPAQLPGGYVGVDVFFVISGFLITSHLMREADRTGSVSLAGFWARRLRRLLPASYVVLLASAVGVLVWVPRLLWQQFFGEILAAALYFENWKLAVDAVDYLAADNNPSPAQHYWTLSAEEQFYLVWPLLVLVGLWVGAYLLARRRVREERFRHLQGRTLKRQQVVVVVVLTLVTGASLAYSLWITATNSAYAYFVTPARAWEFGAGALLAFVPAGAGRVRRLRALAGWAALGGLVACALVYDAGTPMPGTAALGVVGAAAVLIWVGAPATWWASSRLLMLRPVRYLGDISYAVYLWHWPLIILLPYVTEHPLRTVDKVSILLATVGLAALTKRLVEDPVRSARRFGLSRPRVTFAYAAVGALVLTAVCVVPRMDVTRDVAQTQAQAKKLAADEPPCFGAASRDPETHDCPNPALAKVLVPTPAAAAEDYPKYSACYAQMYRTPLVPCHFGTPKPGVPHIAVIGDSHARVLMTSVEKLVDAGELTADLLVQGGCPWSTIKPDTTTQEGRSCGAFQSQLQPLLQRTAKTYDFILTTARISGMRGTPQQRVAGLSDAWTRVTRLGVPVVVVRDNPQDVDPARNPNLCLAEVPVQEADARCSLSRSQKLDHWYDALSAAAARTPGSEVVDLTDFFCDDTTCPVVIGGVNVYVDDNHVSVTYARTLAPYLLRDLVSLGLLPS